MKLIDADRLQKLFNATSSALLSDVELSKDIEHVVRACLMVSEMISDAPTIDAELVKHGKWVRLTRGWYCSSCRELVFPKTMESGTDYCPFCGAKMGEVENG